MKPAEKMKPHEKMKPAAILFACMQQTQVLELLAGRSRPMKQTRLSENPSLFCQRLARTAL